MKPPVRQPSTSTDALGRRPRGRRLALVSTAMGLVALGTGCKLPTFGEDSGATTQARHEMFLYQGFFVAGIAVGVFVLALIVWVFIRYRRTDDSIPKQTGEHVPVEIIYTVIPILIVIALFAATVITENKVNALSPTPVNIDVTAYQWGWKFCYSGYDENTGNCHGVEVHSGNVVIGQENTYPDLNVPQGENVHIILRAQDVVHGFYVRALNFSRYAQPGITNEFDLTFVKTGTFIGQCTQLCGLQHDLMLFKIVSMPPSAYNSWLSQQKALVGQSSASSSP